jgi:methionine-rich copper-binding protein CopC
VRFLLVVGTALGALLGGTLPALAHGLPLASDPSPLTTVDTAPEQVSVYFAGALLPDGTSLVVTGPDGQPIDNGDTVVNGASATVSLRHARPAGNYTVFWTINAADGHQDAGAFQFSSSFATGVGHSGSMRWLAPLSTIVLLAGLAVAVFFLWRTVNRSAKSKPAPVTTRQRTSRTRR